MDSNRFDQLARTLATSLPRRRVPALVSALGLGLGTRLTAIETTADKKKDKDKNDKVRCNGAWVPRCTGGKFLDHTDCQCRCPNGMHESFDPDCYGLCVLTRSPCCPDKRVCAAACIPKDDCCNSTERECTKKVRRGKNKKKKTVTVCVPLNECCPGKQKCSTTGGTAFWCCDASAGDRCTSEDGCCNTRSGERICDGKWCCSGTQKCCPGKGCIPQSESCCVLSCESAPNKCCQQGEQCTQIDGCCGTRPGEHVCDGKWCCAENETCCPGEGCVPVGESCCTSSCPGAPDNCCKDGEVCTQDMDGNASCCVPGRTPCGGSCCGPEPGGKCCKSTGTNPFYYCCAPHLNCKPSGGNTCQL
jgi:hypothetical protein